MAPSGITPTAPRRAPAPVRRKMAPVEDAVPVPVHQSQDTYAGSASELVGQVVMLPVSAVLFVGNASLMLAKLLMFQVTHPFQLDVPRVIRWVNDGMHGEPPTTDPDMLAMLIRTQNPGFADLMSGYVADHPQAQGDVVAVMRWAIATQGKGLPPTRDPRLLAKLIGTQNADFADLMTRYLDAHPKDGADAAEVMRWAIRTRGTTGAPQIDNPQLLGALIATQNAKVANALLEQARTSPREVAKVMRWAMETRGKGLPPTNDPGVLAALIGTQEPAFAKLMRDYMKGHPAASKDVAAVERWAIQTRGKGLPPTEDPGLLAELIGTQNAGFAKLMREFLAGNPAAGKDVAAIEKWAIETRGQGVPPTNNPRLLAALIGTQEPAFAKLLEGFAKEAPEDVAAVAKWAIETRGKGVPPTSNAKLLAALIATQEPGFGKLMQDFLKANPGTDKDVAEVERWAIETHGQGVPPGHNAKLLGTLIASKEPGFGKLMLDFLAAYPAKQADVAAVERWAIETRGKGLPPTDDPELLAMLIGTQEQAPARMLLEHLHRVPSSGPEVAKVAKWMIATHGQGLPPTDDARLLASLIGLKAPVLARELDVYAATNPKKAGDVAKLEQWLIGSGGKPKTMPPVYNPGLMVILAKYALK